MPVPAWNGFANHRSRLASEDEESNPAIAPRESPDARDHATDAPTALDVAPPDELVAADSLLAVSRSRAFRWLGVTTLAAAALVVFVTILVAAPEPRAKSSAASKPTQPSVAVPALTRPEASETAETLTPLPSAQPAADMLELSVRASPTSARIMVDGIAVAENPFRASYPKDGETHRIAVRADGYESKAEDVSLSKDTVVNISLNQRSAARTSTNVALLPAPAPHATKRAAVQPTLNVGPPPYTQTPIASTGGEVDAAGGRLPLRPIETRDPYGIP
jgi:serine/threonine-protein kinase